MYMDIIKRAVRLYKVNKGTALCRASKGYILYRLKNTNHKIRKLYHMVFVGS